MTRPYNYELPVGTIQTFLAESENLTDFLSTTVRHMAQLAGSTLGELHITLGLVQSEHMISLVHSDAEAHSLDEVQRWYAKSPYREAIRTGEAVFVADTSADPDNECLQTLASAGIKAVLVYTIPLAGGALFVSTTYFHEFLDQNPAENAEFGPSTEASLMILNLALRMAHSQDTQADLKAALSSRTVIDLAVGILMGQKRCTPEEAVDMLKTAAKTHHVKMRDVAARLVSKTGASPVTTHFKD